MDDRFTPEEHLTSDLHNVAMGWVEIGIDPDDFLKCGVCHKWMRDCVDSEDVTTADGIFLPGIPDSACCTC